MIDFKSVKSLVTAREAAEHYGLTVNRYGMACCPFHEDRHPSMKLDERFHCFGCGADGDVIDFAARLFRIPLREAAERLAADFGIAPGRPGAPLPPRQKSPQAQCYEVLLEMYHLSRTNVERAFDVVANYDEKAIQVIEADEELIDSMADQISNYLVALSGHISQPEHTEILNHYYTVVTEFERLGDHAMNIASCAREESVHTHI